MEGDADKVILIHNPHLEAFADLDESIQAQRVQAQLIVAKHRGGPKGNATVWFTPTETRFDMCEESWQEPSTKSEKAESEVWWS